MAARQCYLAKHKGGRPFLGSMCTHKVDHLMLKPQTSPPPPKNPQTFLLQQALYVFINKAAIVISPTPPGTGVI